MANKPFFNFSGGMNARAAPLLLKENECELIINFHLDRLGALSRRGGYTGFGGQPVADNNILGLFNFYDASGGTSIPLMVVNNSGDTNSVIYYLTGGTWTISNNTNNTANARHRFAAFIDYVFAVNGNQVVESSTDGATWGTTNCPATITPRYIGVFQDRVYLAHGNASNRSRLWFSSLPSAGAITWDTTNDFVDVNPDDGDEITGLENNGNRLLIFKHRALYRWTFGQVEPDKLIGVGTDSQESIATNLDLGITFFLNQNGVYAYTGNRPRLISRKIQKYINSISSFTSTYGAVDDDHYYLYVGNLTVDGRTISRAMLCYTISLDAWTIFSLADTVTAMARLDNIGTGFQVCFGAATGRTHLFTPVQGGNGVSPPGQYTSDNGTVISAEFTTKEHILSYPQRTNVRWIDVFALQRTNALVFYDLDRLNNFVQLDGSLTSRTTNFRIPVSECNTIRIKAMEQATSADEAPSIIEGFNIEHEPKEKRDEQKIKVRLRPTGYNN